MNSAPPDLRRPSGGRVLVFAGLVGVLATLALIAAAALRASGDARVPVVSLTALLLLAVKPALDRLAGWTYAPRAAVVSALSCLGIAPLLVLSALMAMGDPILSSHFRCGTGDMALAMLAPIPFFLFGTLGALFAVALAGNERPRVDALIRGARRGVVVLAAVVFAGALIRAARRPDAEHYLASLPEVGVLKPVSGEPIKIVPAKEAPSISAETRIYEDRLGDIVVRRECVSGNCQVSLRALDEPLPAGTQKWMGVDAPGDAPLPVSRDEKHDIWVLGQRMAFQGKDFRLIDIQVATVADGLSPPLGWILGAFVGLLIALGIAVQHRRLSRREAALVAAIAGVHTQNGWITVDDSLPASRAAPDLALPAGPVLIMPGRGASGGGGAYRGDGSLHGVEIIAGLRDAHLTSLRGRMAALDAFTISALLLTAAPLAAAWLRGLLW